MVDSDEDYRSKIDFLNDSLVGCPDMKRKYRMIQLLKEFIHECHNVEDDALLK